LTADGLGESFDNLDAPDDLRNYVRWQGVRDVRFQLIGKERAGDGYGDEK
jgi:hypothetical protein